MAGAPFAAIGVLGAVSVAAGVVADGTVADLPADGPLLGIEHPTGVFDVTIRLPGAGSAASPMLSGVVRIARKIADGTVWPRTRETR